MPGIPSNQVSGVWNTIQSDPGATALLAQPFGACSQEPYLFFIIMQLCVSMTQVPLLSAPGAEGPPEPRAWPRGGECAGVGGRQIGNGQSIGPGSGPFLLTPHRLLT